MPRRCSFPLSGCQQPAPKEWTIPFLNSLTGAIASIGEYLEWGAERAAKEINDAGGIKGKPVRIVGVDTALDPQKGSTEMARLVKDTLVALGPVPEPVIMAAMPIAVENGMPSITATRRWSTRRSSSRGPSPGSPPPRTGWRRSWRRGPSSSPT